MESEERIMSVIDRAVKGAMEENSKKQEMQLIDDVINIYDGTIETYDAYLEINKQRAKKQNEETGNPYVPIIPRKTFIYIKHKKNDSIYESAWKRLKQICSVYSLDNPYTDIKFTFIDDFRWLIENDYDVEQLIYVFDDTNFIHDIMGIYKNLKILADGSYRMDNCFVPRCRKKVKGGDK